MSRTKWTDERIGDLAKITVDNDGRLDRVQEMATKSKDDIEALLKRDALGSRNRWERYAIAAALCSPLITLILHFLPTSH